MIEAERYLCPREGRSQQAGSASERCILVYALHVSGDRPEVLTSTGRVFRLIITDERQSHKQRSESMCFLEGRISRLSEVNGIQPHEKYSAKDECTL